MFKLMFLFEKKHMNLLFEVPFAFHQKSNPFMMWWLMVRTAKQVSQISLSSISLVYFKN